MPEIRYSVEPEFHTLGRNGISRTFGINVSTFKDEIHLEPINSRGKITQCLIPVPREDLPALIKALQAHV